MDIQKPARPQSTCIHCGVEIQQVSPRLWVDDCKVFPQYCNTTPENKGEQLHEPTVVAEMQ